ncbi:MAG: hypothetical protein IT436_00950 [Phycisphaerales bacterium]|nr:hypothetical protein [Phycisphaerales bacterium]
MAIALNAGPVPDSRREIGVSILKWLGRGLALLLVLFWGAFFIEHLNEWYRQPQGYPPPWVTIAMGFHLGMIVGLLLSLRWDRLGVLITIISTVGFMVASGAVIPLMLINLAPAACFAAARLLNRRAGTAPPGLTA